MGLFQFPAAISVSCMQEYPKKPKAETAKWKDFTESDAIPGSLLPDSLLHFFLLVSPDFPTCLPLLLDGTLKVPIWLKGFQRVFFFFPFLPTL